MFRCVYVYACVCVIMDILPLEGDVYSLYVRVYVPELCLIRRSLRISFFFAFSEEGECRRVCAEMEK